MICLGCLLYFPLNDAIIAIGRVLCNCRDLRSPEHDGDRQTAGRLVSLAARFLRFSDLELPGGLYTDQRLGRAAKGNDLTGDSVRVRPIDRNNLPEAILVVCTATGSEVPASEGPYGPRDHAQGNEKDALPLRQMIS